MPTIVFEEKNGDRRALVVHDDLIVLPGAMTLTDDQWAKVQGAFGAKGYIARGELYSEDKPPARTPRKPQNVPGKPPPLPPSKLEELAVGEGSASASEIADFVRQASAMSVTDLEMAIVGIEDKGALIALMNKDNRAAIQEMCKARLDVLP